MKITTIIRTHKRKDQLTTCLQSIATCKYSDLQIIIISDCDEDPIEEIVKSIKWEAPLDWVRFKPSLHSWPPNDYFNQIHHLVKGEFITYIDDDDGVIDNNYYQAIANAIKPEVNMLIWKANLGRLYTRNRDTILPEPKNWQKRPVLSHFSTLNMGVRSNLAKDVKWPQRRGGDGLFAQAFWDKHVVPNKDSIVFIDQVLTGTQKSLSTHKSYE